MWENVREVAVQIRNKIGESRGSFDRSSASCTSVLTSGALRLRAQWASRIASGRAPGLPDPVDHVGEVARVGGGAVRHACASSTSVVRDDRERLSSRMRTAPALMRP
jgi:hypothetical protein